MMTKIPNIIGTKLYNSVLSYLVDWNYAICSEKLVNIKEEVQLEHDNDAHCTISIAIDEHNELYVVYRHCYLDYHEHYIDSETTFKMYKIKTDTLKE